MSECAPFLECDHEYDEDVADEPSPYYESPSHSEFRDLRAYLLSHSPERRRTSSEGDAARETQRE